MNYGIVKSTIITTVTLISIVVTQSPSYAEKVVPIVDLTTGALSMSVTSITKNMSDNNEALEFWVFCPGGSGGGMGGGGMCNSPTLPSPTLTLTPNTAADVTLNMMMAPQEDGSITMGNSSFSNPYIGHTIHLHGLDMETQYDGVPETFQAEPVNNESSVDLRNGFTYKINSDSNNIRVDERYIGSHMYHCHVHTVKHLEMGMYGGFVVKGSGNKANWINNSGGSFDEEWIMMLSTVDPTYHSTAAQGDSDIFADYNPKYFLVNGEEGNGITINPLLSKTIILAQGQTKNVVIRLMGMHSTNAIFSIMSGSNKIPFTLYNIDGFALKTPSTETSVELSPGQTKDVMITLDKAITYNPQIAFTDLRNNKEFNVKYSDSKVVSSIVKTELIVTQN